MAILMLGLFLWAAVHFVPSIGRPLRVSLVGAMGENRYKILFAVLMLAALALIVIGWRQSVPTYIYFLPPATKHIAYLLIVVAFILFGASHHPSRIKRIVRHPQLTAVMLWAIAHLMLNGDSRSLLLFGWFAVWAALEMLLINRRDGAWEKPPAPTWGVELRGLAISLVILVVVVFIHPYIAGVPVH